MRLARCTGAPCQKGFREMDAQRPSPVCCATYLCLFCGWKGFRRSPNFEDDFNRFPDSSLPALRFCSFTSTSCRPLQLLGAMNHFRLQPEQHSHQHQGLHSSACPNSGKPQHCPAHFLVRGSVTSCAGIVVLRETGHL